MSEPKKISAEHWEKAFINRLDEFYNEGRGSAMDLLIDFKQRAQNLANADESPDLQAEIYRMREALALLERLYNDGDSCGVCPCCGSEASDKPRINGCTEDCELSRFLAKHKESGND